MIDSIAPGDDVMVLGKVISTVGGEVVVEIEGECVTVKPSRLARPVGGQFAALGPYRKGREARAAGKSISQCPYADTPKGRYYRRAWLKGWMESE